MRAKDALLICLTSLSSVFGMAAAPAQAQEAPQQDPITATYTPPAPTETRLPFNRGVQSELRNTAVKVLWKLSTHGEWELSKKIWALSDIIYDKLPVPVYNRLVTALNNDTDRAKIVKALIGLANGVIGSDKAAAEKCRESIRLWSQDPLGFARYISGVIGKDIVQAPAPTTTAPAVK